MSSIAQTVKSMIKHQCPTTFSLYAGYGMSNGAYIRWPGGLQELEKRNENGQVATARYRYADGSTLTYKRRPDNDYVLIVG